MLCTFIDLTINKPGDAALFFCINCYFFVFLGIFLLLHTVNKLQTVPLLIQTGNHSSGLSYRRYFYHRPVLQTALLLLDLKLTTNKGLSCHRPQDKLTVHLSVYGRINTCNDKLGSLSPFIMSTQEGLPNYLSTYNMKTDGSMPDHRVTTND